MQGNLVRGSIGRTLFRFSLPLVLSMAAGQLYSLVDAMLIGARLSTAALAGVANATSVIMLCLFVSGGIELGVNLLVASVKPTAGEREFGTLVFNLLTLDLAVSLVMLAAGQLALPCLLRLLRTPEEIMGAALTYARIYLAGLPLVMLFDVSKQILIGAGDSRTPMIFILVSTLANIALDVLLLYGFNCGVGGAAAATLAAQALGLVPCAVLIRRRFLRERRSIADLSWKCAGRVARFSLPSITQQLTMPVMSMVNQRLLGSIGVAAIAGFSASGRLTSFLIMPLAGFNQAFTIFLAQNRAAGETARAREGVRLARWVMLGLAAGLVALCTVLRAPLLRPFELDEAALCYAGAFLCGGSLSYLAASQRFVNESILRAAGRMRAYTAANLSYVAAQLLLVTVLAAQLGYRGFYIAGWISNTLGLALGAGLVRREGG